MRFSNDNYLKAFPREDKPVKTKVTIVDPDEGDVLDQEPDPEVKEPEPIKEPEEVKEGDPDGIS